jgi:Flp pilus assembly protein TadG
MRASEPAAGTTQNQDSRTRRQRGQAMVEFAIIVPILLTVLLGIMQLGVVYNNWVTLTDAARAGARKGAVCRSGCTPNAQTATVNAVKNSAANLNQSSLGVTVTSTWAQGADVRVEASYPWSVNVLGIVVASGTMRATTTERVE